MRKSPTNSGEIPTVVFPWFFASFHQVDHDFPQLGTRGSSPSASQTRLCFAESPTAYLASGNQTQPLAYCWKIHPWPPCFTSGFSHVERHKKARSLRKRMLAKLAKKEVGGRLRWNHIGRVPYSLSILGYLYGRRASQIDLSLCFV